MFRNLIFSIVLMSFLAGCGKDDVAAILDNLGNNNGSTAPVAYKLMKVTTTDYKGDFNGSAGADTLCNGDFPGYKAFVTDDHRFPDTGGGALDWILAGNTEYRQEDGVTIIGTTDANGVFGFDLDNGFLSAGYMYWTGFATDWTTSLNNCSDWTSQFGNGVIGAGNQLTAGSINMANISCGFKRYLLCVQQ